MYCTVSEEGYTYILPTMMMMMIRMILKTVCQEDMMMKEVIYNLYFYTFLRHKRRKNPFREEKE
jgi:hypothetical protein